MSKELRSQINSSYLKSEKPRKEQMQKQKLNKEINGGGEQRKWVLETTILTCSEVEERERLAGKRVFGSENNKEMDLSI